MSWQNMRSMSDLEFAQALASLKLSRAAAGRYLGLGSRTIFGYCEEGRPIPVTVALLLNALIELHIAPIVPQPKRRAGQARIPDASSAASGASR